MKLRPSIPAIMSFVLITILLISDFFPDSPVFGYFNNGSLFWILFAAFGISMIIEVRKNKRENYYLQIIFTIYIVFLLLLLTLLGGESVHGFAANQGAFWIVVILCIIDIISFRKKQKLKEE